MRNATTIRREGWAKSLRRTECRSPCPAELTAASGDPGRGPEPACRQRPDRHPADRTPRPPAPMVTARQILYAPACWRLAHWRRSLGWPGRPRPRDSGSDGGTRSARTEIVPSAGAAQSRCAAATAPSRVGDGSRNPASARARVGAVVIIVRVDGATAARTLRKHVPALGGSRARQDTASSTAVRHRRLGRGVDSCVYAGHVDQQRIVSHADRSRQGIEVLYGACRDCRAQS